MNNLMNKMLAVSIKAGLKKFEERGNKAVTKELYQLHDMVAFFPLDLSMITKE